MGNSKLVYCSMALAVLLFYEMEAAKYLLFFAFYDIKSIKKL